MSHLLSIGEFSRLTHLSIKALRHYDDLGLLQPASVDPSSGYRQYAAAQVPTAQLIRRFRDLEMPLDQVRAVLGATSSAQRDDLVVEHLRRMETKLDETRTTVASLRALLEGGGWDLPVEHRRIGATTALALAEVVAWDETDRWLTEALTELDAALEAGDLQRAGPDGALYSDEFFQAHLGEVVAFVPITSGPSRERRQRGGIDVVELPAVDVAVIVHRGPFNDIDTTYGVLGAYVNERLIAAPGPIREHYLGSDDADPDASQVEVCWPIRPDDQGATP